MSDWTDEVRDRLLTPSTVSGTWGAPEDGPWCVKRAADIRAALGEIGRRGLQYPDDLGISRDAAGLSARCAELRDRLVAQGKRAEAAEAKLAEAERTIERLNTGLAQTISDRDILRAEVGRLRDLLTRAAEVVWRYDLERGDGQQVSQLAQEIVTALRGDGESTGMGHALPDQQCSPIEHKALRAEVERLREALGRVLTEAGLQAHKHGCANKIARPAQWDARLPCAGCQAESALQGR